MGFVLQKSVRMDKNQATFSSFPPLPFLRIFVKELGSTDGYVLKKDLRSPYQSTFLAKNFAVKRYLYTSLVSDGFPRPPITSWILSVINLAPRMSGFSLSSYFIRASTNLLYASVSLKAWKAAYILESACNSTPVASVFASMGF